MSLTKTQVRHLRGLGHTLKPVVMIGGGGLSDGVIGELNQSLEHHELLKVRVSAEDREERDALIEQMCKAVSCNLVQRIGHIALVYRPAQEPVLKLPR
ncbi:MAG TPA: ribosome assembly RNA-binding protein YhbY [Ectothiorhodospiraceae bacterium]|nr:ribosome assembly RNA-binding protein YhbY [Ectothiorhodospiraceae bacterium]